MPKFTVKQLVEFIGQNGRVRPKDFERIGFPGGNLNAYLRDRIRNGTVIVEKTLDGVYYSLSDEGKRLAGIKVEPAAPATPAAPVINTSTNPSLDAAIDALCQAIVVRISNTVEQQVGSMVDQLVTRQVANTINKLTAGIATLPAARDVVPATVDKKKVTIIGLLPDQQEMIRREFGNDLDIRCIGSNDNSGLVKSNAAHSDIVLLMADFISHQTVRLVESVGARHVLVRGGMSSLRDAITKYYVGE